MCDVMERVKLPWVIGYLVDRRDTSQRGFPLFLQRLVDEQRSCCPHGRRCTGAPNWYPQPLIIDGNVIGSGGDIWHLAVAVGIAILDARPRLPRWAREIFILADAAPRPPLILAL